MTIRHPDIGKLYYEFPDFPEESVPATLPSDAIPMHWHNDVCPSWCVAGPADHDLGVVLWIDYPDIRRREHWGERFALTSGDVVYQTDRWPEVLKRIDEAREQLGPPREVSWLHFTAEEFKLAFGHAGETITQVVFRMKRVLPPGYLFEHILNDQHTLTLLDDPKMPLKRRD
jgi:hypothetical protein